MRMRKSILLLGATALLGGTAQAASVTRNVTGNLDLLQWRWGLSSGTWNDFYATSQAQFDAAFAKGNAENDYGYSTPRGTFHPFALQLTGSITYDDVTNQVTALTLSQVGAASGLRPIVNSSFDAAYKTYSADAETSYSGASWVLGSNALGQTLDLQGLDNVAATGIKVDYCYQHVNGANSNCVGDPTGSYRTFLGYVTGNGVGSGDPYQSGESGASTLAEKSFFDFAGIPSGFKPGNSTYTHPSNLAGATFGISGNTVNVDLYARSGLGTVASIGGSSSEKAHMTLTLAPVPVPGAVWLFGSGLGLLGFVRRKSIA